MPCRSIRAGLPGHLAVIVECGTERYHDASTQLIANIPAAEFVDLGADGGNGFFVWLAANDLAAEGNWIWDGDNNGIGQLFYQGRGNAGGGAVGGLYHNWGTFRRRSLSEPDNGSAERTARLPKLASPWPTTPAASPDQWNDVRARLRHSRLCRRIRRRCPSRNRP